MNTVKHNVCAFCKEHLVVLDTLYEWRPLDSNFTWTHQFFGAVVSGITDGIVAWTLHASGELAFVHFDLLSAERIPSRQGRAPRVSTRPRNHKPTLSTERPRLATKDFLDKILENVDY
jgi:hypothetical protein